MIKTSLVVFTLTASLVVSAGTFEQMLVDAAIERTRHSVRYDGSYMRIGYPGGDVPNDMGVCTDVVIRAYRATGIDLQRQVHEDMTTNFNAYPSRRIWGLNGTDSNIDHRRVPNLQAFFTRKGRVLPVTLDSTDYVAGDIVTWMLPGNLPHIGIVTDKADSDTGEPLVVHNIGSGPKLENMLFDYPITGHYRYHPVQ
ncbi:MAG: DUF1287 domain-containing protein [Sedimenticola sp.]